MELIESQKETSTSISSQAKSVSVPAQLSRGKAREYITGQGEVRGGLVRAVPEREATNLLYRLFMKIGATGELPEENALARSFLNDFWIDLYFKNNLVPDDIPFGIVIHEFTTALVQGRVGRKGNNQAAICEAFNDWITREKVRHRLYQLRDEAYPAQKPKQVPQQATAETVRDYSDEELRRKLAAIRHMSGIKMVDEMIAELEAEIGRRSDGKI